jgi:hypothetical protein
MEERSNGSLEGRSIKSFAAKTAIVAIAVCVSAIVVSDWVIDSVESAVARTVENARSQLAPKIGGHQFWAKFEREIDRAADPSNDLPPEKKQKLINDLRIIAARWRPVLEALQDEPQTPASAK